MKKLNKLTLKLFKSILSNEDVEIKIDYENGLIIDRGAVHAESDIKEYIRKTKLTGEEINKTFHKSWKVIKESSRFELLLHQITHYISTYGTNFEGEVYIPDENLDLPKVKLKFKVIKALSKSELIDKSLDILKSGIALKEETTKEVLEVLDILEYSFTGKEGIRNKEAIVLIADKYGVYPNNPTEFLRYIIFKTTGTTTIIKSNEMINQIKESSYDPSYAFNSFGLKNLSTIFNRFKPIFLAYKNKNKSVINKIAKLSKENHSPMIQNDLNLVTSKELYNTNCLEKATIFAVFKALNACYSRINGQSAFTYRIRNGKSYTKENDSNIEICEKNYNLILSFLKNRLPKNKKVFIPQEIEYALPTSKKMFVGNVPTGTRIAYGKLNVGIYWKNSWGARDLDLSSIDVSGRKVGWNSYYNNDNVYYSGDMTNACNGAVEFLRFNKPEKQRIINLNVYFGSDNPNYKIVIGSGSKVDRNYMMNPNKVDFETKCQAPQRQTSIGLVHSENGKSVFTFLNFGTGSLNVSGGGELSRLRIESLFQQWNNSISFNKLIRELGWKIVDKSEDADIDLSFDNLEKDTFLEIFN